MRIKHRVPVRELTSDPITPEYQAQVDRSTATLERRYRQAEDRLQRARDKADKAADLVARAKRAPEQRQLKRQHEKYIALVEERERELAEIISLMQPAGASAQHRGKKSYRPVPITKQRNP